MLAKLAVTVAMMLGLGTLTADALGASLAVGVNPTTVHPGSHYTITVSGRYDVRSRGTVYVLSFIQYGGQPCQATGTAEYNLSASDWDWDFFPQRGETKSPFREVVAWNAGRRLGMRRVCAYMYTEPVRPTTRARPIARASASYRNTKR